MKSNFCFLNSAPLFTGRAVQVGNPVCPVKWENTARKPCRATVKATAGAGSTQKLVWVDAIALSEIVPGTAKRCILAGLDICLACAENGEVFALGNKGPPLGMPLSEGDVVEVNGVNYIRDPQYGTHFELGTGTVKEGTWISSPPIISNVLRVVFGEPEGVVTFQVRDNGEVLQVCVDANARNDYEKSYWKGVLDATGKADGGYY